MAAVAAAFEAPIKPPRSVRLRPGSADRKIWAAIMRLRSRDEWSQIDLQHAGTLVRTVADIERLSAEVWSEGDVVNANGTTYLNPKHRLIETLTRRAIAITRLLHLHASVLIEPDMAKLAKRRESEAEGREAAEAITSDDDDLLARPPRLQ